MNRLREARAAVEAAEREYEQERESIARPYRDWCDQLLQFWDDELVHAQACLYRATSDIERAKLEAQIDTLNGCIEEASIFKPKHLDWVKPAPSAPPVRRKRAS